MRILSFILLFSIFSGNAFGQEGLALKNFSAWSSLPLEVRKAILIWNNQFKPIDMNSYNTEIRDLYTDLEHEAPMRVVEDFNGDGIDDYAILGENQNQQYVIVALSGTNWKILEVERWSDENFKSTPIVTAKDKDTQNSTAIYLTKARGGQADQFKAKNKKNALQIESYLGSVRQFGLFHDKVKEIDL